MEKQIYRVEGFYPKPEQLFSEDVEATNEAEAMETVLEGQDRADLCITDCALLTPAQIMEKAAPELLAALVRLLSDTESDRAEDAPVSQAEKQARAAIAKAGGAK